MRKELPVVLVNKVVDPKRIIGKKWRAKEEERHKGSLTKKKHKTKHSSNANFVSHNSSAVQYLSPTNRKIRTEDLRFLRRIR
jgi:hypothetical protein